MSGAYSGEPRGRKIARRRPSRRGNHLLLRLLTGLLIGFTALASHADDTAQLAPRIQRLGVAEGLPTHTVYSVVADQQGLLWFGTDAGAVRYDGHRMWVLRANLDGLARISSDNASVVFIDHDNTLWIGSWGAGLDRVDLQTWQTTNWRFDPSDARSLASNLVQALFQDRRGRLWIGTGAGLLRFDAPSQQLQRVFTQDEGAEALSARRVWSIAEDAAGILWLATDSGLVEIDPDDGRELSQTPISTDPNRPDAGLRTVHIDRAGRIWVGGHAGFGRFDPQQRTFTPVSAPAEFGAVPIIVNSAIEADPQHIWLGTWSGVWLLDTERAELVTIGDSSLKQWFPSDDVRALHRDPSGELWAATRYHGLARIDLATPRFRLYGRELREHAAGSGGEQVRAIYRGAGQVWLNTDGAVMRIDLDRGRFEPIASTVGLRAGRGGSIAFDDSGNALLPTLFGPARLQLATGQVALMSELRQSAQLRDPNLFLVVRDSRDRLWWSTQREGMFVTDIAGRLLRRHQPGSGQPGQLTDTSVTVVLEDSQQRVWLGSFNGLSRYDETSQQFINYRYSPDDPTSLSNPRVNALLDDSAGRLWVGTQAGVDRFDPLTESFQHVSGGPSALAINALVEAAPGELWAASGSSLRRIDAATARFDGPPIDPGVPDLVITPGAALRYDDRRLLFGTNQGLLLYDAAADTGAGFLPPVRITELLIDQQPIALPTRISDQLPVAIPAVARSLSIGFAALDYRAVGENRYRYRLHGFDPDWIELRGLPSVTYTNLEPGEYRFEVQGAGADRLWNEAGDRLRIRVLPPFWREPAVQVVIVLLLMLTTFAGLRAYARRVRRHEAELARQVDARTAEIAEQSRQLEITLTELRRSQQQIVLQEKMASLGTLTAGVAHEINNPANFTRVGAQNLRHGLAAFEQVLGALAGPDVDPEVAAVFGQRFAALREQLDTVQEGAERIAAIVGQLRRFTRLDEAERNLADVDECLQTTLSLVRTQYGDAMRFELELSSTQSVDGWPAQLNQVFMNLIVNACQAIVARHGRDPASGCLQLVSRDVDDGVQIEVIDNGGGVPFALRSRVFEPFFTTKGVGEGTGLGLAIAYGIVERHGGTLQVDADMIDGSRFVVWLPWRAPDADETAPGDAVATAVGGSVRFDGIGA